MRLAVLALLLTITCQTNQAQDTQRRPVTINVNEGEAIKGYFIGADEISVTIQSGVAESTIKLEKVVSIVFDKEDSSARSSPASTLANKQPAIDAIKALRKLASATEVGVSYTEYGRILIEAKTEVVGALPNIQDPEVKRNISSAMEEYAYAGEVWTYFFRNKSIATKSDMGRGLIDRYNIPIKISLFTSLTRDSTLPYIWRSAREYYEKAVAKVGH